MSKNIYSNRNIYNKLKNFYIHIEDPGPGEDFVNWCFGNMCRPDCGVECNNYYVEGPELQNIIGCFIKKYNITQANKIIRWLELNQGLEYKNGVPKLNDLRGNKL